MFQFWHFDLHRAVATPTWTDSFNFVNSIAKNCFRHVPDPPSHPPPIRLYIERKSARCFALPQKVKEDEHQNAIRQCQTVYIPHTLFSSFSSSTHTHCTWILCRAHPLAQAGKENERKSNHHLSGPLVARWVNSLVHHFLLFLFFSLRLLHCRGGIWRKTRAGNAQLRHSFNPPWGSKEW